MSPTPEALITLDAVLELLRAVPACAGAESITPLREGFSDDEKYIGYHAGKPTWLVRISAVGTRTRREREAAVLSQLHGMGVPCPVPFWVGEASGGLGCLIASFIPGASADRALPGLPQLDQRHIGQDAGRVLWAMHQLSGHVDQHTYREERLGKHRARLARAAELQVSYEGQGAVDSFIEAHLPLLRTSQVRFQHDDFHPGNLIVDAGRFAGVVDFNRCDEGDPIEDFCKIPWFSLPCSRSFSQGQIEGYLEQETVPDFWVRYHFFLAINLIPSLVWIRNVGRTADFAAWQMRVDDIVRTHDFVHPDQPPKWYGA